MQSRWIFAFGAIALASAAACQVILGIDDRSVYVDRNDGDADTGVVVGDGSACRGPNVPAAPDLSTSDPSDPYGVITTLSKLDLGMDGGTYGFNLDRACTCPEPDTCQRPLANGKKLPPACDDPNGVDNAAKPLFAFFSLFVNQSILNQAIADGLSNVFLRIEQYNGLPDDAHVEVSVYASLGYKDAPDAAPKFDGNDEWIVDQASTQNSDLGRPTYKASEAYVRQGTLVASLKFPIILGGGVIKPVVIELESGKIVARLDMNGTSITRIHGQLAGRWDVSKLLTSLQNVPDPTDKTQFLCGPNSTFATIKPRVCDSVDITADPTNDGTGICDAVSLALGFESLPAKFGAVMPQPAAAYPCGMGYVATCP
jgi:hypothetical protein